MQLRNIIIIKFLLINFLNGCVWFDSGKDIITMSPLPKVNNQFQPIMVWNRSISNGINNFYSNLHPSWQKTQVFTADRYGIVQALNIDNGEEIWSKNLSIHTSFFSRNKSAKLSSGVTIADNRIYIGSELAKVYALDTQDGSIIWQTRVAGEVLSTPVVSNGMVLIHTSNGLLQALNEINGVIRWTISLDIPQLALRGKSTPTVILDTAIIGGNNGQVSAIMLNQGNIIWQQYISQPSGTTEISQINDVQMTPVVINDVVYAIAYNGNFAAIDLHSGQIIWSREIGSVNNLAVDNNHIYLIDQNDCVIAMNIYKNKIIWQQSSLLHRNLTSPVLYNGYLVTGDSKGYLHWINTSNGQFVVQQKVDNSGMIVSPIVADNKLIIQMKNGCIYAFTN